MIEKDELIRMVKYGDNNKYSHVIICCDTFSYEYFPHYVTYDEDIKALVRELQGKSSQMLNVMEVYNYNLDLDKQLKEARAFHIEPLCKRKTYESKKTLEALNYASTKHKNQFRINGSPYIRHPIKVAEYVSEFKKSKNIDILVSSAYLHDTLEDTDTTYYDIYNKFGATVASLVLELTTDEDMKNALGKTKYLEIKMKNMSSWALVIKLCDRLSNISDLDVCDEKFRNKYIKETVEIINYLINNRKLSKTHISIIKVIVGKINKLKRLYTDNDIEFDFLYTKVYSL